MSYTPTSDDLVKHEILGILIRRSKKFRRSTLATAVNVSLGDIDFITEEMAEDQSIVKMSSPLDEFYIVSSPKTEGYFTRKFYLTNRNIAPVTHTTVNASGRSKVALNSTLQDSMNDGSSDNGVNKAIKYLIKKWWAWAILVILTAILLYVQSHSQSKRINKSAVIEKAQKIIFST